MKILYFYCGEGLGHCTRTIAAGKALEKEHEVTYASYGYAREFGIKAGLSVTDVPSEISLVGTGGKFSVSKSIFETIKNAKPTAILKYLKLIKKEEPDLVISDSFVIPAMLSKNKKIPTWMILNQSSLDKFFAFHKNPAVRFIGKFVKKFNFSALKKMDKILVCDFAPPNTICRDSLTFPKKAEGKVVYLGPVVREEYWKSKPNKPKKKTVFCGISGFGYRKLLLDKTIEASKMLPEYNFILVAGPNAKILSKNKNVKTYGNITNPFPLMDKSDLIISGGGHSVIMESMVLGKPILSAPDMAHFEQESNANGVERLCAGRKISYNTPVNELVELIEELSNSKKYKQTLQKMKKLSKKQDGRKTILKMVKELEQTQTPPSF